MQWDGWTALVLAASEGLVEIVNALLAEGANMEATSKVMLNDRDWWLSMHCLYIERV